MHFALYLMQNNPDPEQAMKILMTVLPLVMIFVLVLMFIIILPFWFICKKAGFSPWLSLLCAVPSVGMLILLYVLAFADWKVTPVATAQLGYPPPPPPQL